ncbi:MULTISPECIES: hypothetical protein [unclassified Streptomyces]|uniref:hypothetical protein n=1 Tax=unclassified Streptomyces TaxID=2593676 RepID=UPI003D745C13
MSFGSVAQELAMTAPWVLAAIIVAVILIVVTGGLVGLVVVLHGTTEAARPVIIHALGDLFRALGDFLRALFGRRK